MDIDLQVHVLVDCTIDVVGSGCDKWASLNGATADLHIVDDGCILLFRTFRLAILPRRQQFFMKRAGKRLRTRRGGSGVDVEWGRLRRPRGVK